MANKSRYAVGLDAGSLRTRCVICAVEDEVVQFLGYGEAASDGWNRGRIADPYRVSDSIVAAVEQAEGRAQVLIDSAVVGVGGTAVHGSNSRGVYEFPRPHAVEANDLEFAVGLATRVRLEDDRLLLQVLPQDFTVDGRAGYRNPRGAVCSRLEANVHLVTASAQEHQCLLSAVQQARVAVEETVFEPIAAAYAAVSPEERKGGVAVVDIGMDSTGLAIYDGDALLVATSVPVSADHFTRDIAWGLRATCGMNVAYEDAERLKRQYGCAILGLTADNTLVEAPSPDGRPGQEITRRQLNEILEARAEELFLYLRGEIEGAGLDHPLMEGIVLTGGGCLLNGVCDIAERVLNCQAQFGLAEGIEDWPEELRDPTWTTVAGLAMYSARLKMHGSLQHPAPGFLGLVLR